jgi:hypothetical protein
MPILELNEIIARALIAGGFAHAAALAVKLMLFEVV